MTIHNQRDEPVQLKKRYWCIADNSGYIQKVTGRGVVGETPLILPKQTYEYASGVALKTASGMMYGHYIIETAKTKETLTISIPVFSLDSPFETTVMN